MRTDGNCGQGDREPVQEPREGHLHVDRVEEIAWHHGKTAWQHIKSAPRRRAAAVPGDDKGDTTDE